MATAVVEPATNGVDTQSPAAQLAARHGHDEVHQPTIEDVVDEEDVAHPPPSSAASTTASSAKPKGKGPALDVQSEDAFPALGGGSKPRAATPMAWGAPKAAAAAKRAPTNGFSNGLSAGPTPSLNGSRASTPASGTATPGLTAAAQPSFRLPGQKTDKLSFTPDQLLPRDQLKKPLRDIVRDISKRSKASIEMRHGQDQTYIFEAKGPTMTAVHQALREVAKTVGAKVTIKVPVPASSRAHIIGKGGSVISAIHERTGARIQVPRPDESSAAAAADEDDDLMVEVLIEGDAASAGLAREEIMNLVKERNSNVNLRLKEIPAEYFPFISGPNNSRMGDLEGRRNVQVRVPEYYTWSQQPPPEVAENELPTFQPTPDRHIHISGDREAALEAQAEIESIVEELRRQITLRQLAINRGQHQFIVGSKSSSLNDFLADTGCAVILPPESDDTEFLTITGPLDQIEAGVNRAMDLATSMQMASVDLSRQHLNAPSGAQAHARALTQYFQQRQAIEELERLYDAHIVLPQASEGPVSWEVYSRDGKNTIKARSDILNLVQAHPPSRLRFVDIDPFFHQHLKSQGAQLIQDEFGVHLIVPDDSQAPQVLLVYEGPNGAEPQYQPPKHRLSSAETAAFEKALVDAQQSLLDLISGQEEIASKSVNVPTKFIEKLHRFVAREQQAKGEGVIPIQVAVSKPNSQKSGAENEVSLRGPASAVDELATKISNFVEEQKRYELERDYTISFDFPQKFANFLIGKRGENINKLRDEFDVDIKIDNGKVEVKGPKAKADAAKSRILSLGKKLEDETTYTLKIPAQYHRELIGQKGAQVNRLQDKYNVRVQFPRSAHAASVEDDVSVVESEHGASKNQRKQQAPDEVIVKGPKKGADSARDDLLSLYQWVAENSFTGSVSVAQSQVPSLIGPRGREMDKLRMETGAQIDVPSAGAEADNAGRIQIKLKGTKKQVEEAKKLLQERVKVFDESITRTIDVDKKHLKSLIGTGGSNIRRIIIEAGGPDDSSASRMVRFPRADSEETLIRLEGNKTVVDNIYNAIEKYVQEREDQVTGIVDVPTEKHRMLIGRGGETRRELESKFNVKIDIPRQGSGKTDVTVKGSNSAVVEAKAHIASLVESQKGETVHVPQRLHHTISDNGQFFRRLHKDLHVTVDHAGQQPPPLASASNGNGNSRGRGTNGTSSLPLITDDPSATDKDNYSWEIVDDSTPPDTANTPTGTIPWILSGTNPENVSKAKQLLEKAIESSKKPAATGYLILPDPKTYRLVIGPGGSQINSIRKKSGCKIDVPKNQAAGEAIEIRGSPDGLVIARDLILETVGVARS